MSSKYTSLVTLEVTGGGSTDKFFTTSSIGSAFAAFSYQSKYIKIIKKTSASFLACLSLRLLSSLVLTSFRLTLGLATLRSPTEGGFGSSPRGASDDTRFDFSLSFRARSCDH